MSDKIKRGVLFQKIRILQTQKYYYQNEKLLEKPPNCSDLATKELAQWKIEKMREPTYLNKMTPV